MTIEITRPEIEALIQQQLDSGAFSNVEDLLFDALFTQRETDLWMPEEGFDVEAHLTEGLAQLDRGEGISSEEFLESIKAEEAAYLKERS